MQLMITPQIMGFIVTINHFFNELKFTFLNVFWSVQLGREHVQSRGFGNTLNLTFIMRKSVVFFTLFVSISLAMTSCEATSVAEQEQEYYEVSKKNLFDHIKPTGTVTPANIRRPGNG